MSNSRDPADFLNKLREDLKHFDESGHLVDDPNVTEIKSILLRRIAELESAFQRTAEIAAAATLEQPSDKPTVTTKRCNQGSLDSDVCEPVRCLQFPVSRNQDLESESTLGPRTCRVF